MSQEGTKRFGLLLLGRVTADAARVWAETSDEDKKAVAIVVMDVAALALRGSWGEDVESELVHVRAQVANWGFVGASKIQAAIKQGIKEGLAIGLGLAIKVVTP